MLSHLKKLDCRCCLPLVVLLSLLFPVYAWSFGIMSPGTNPNVEEELAGVIRYTSESDNSFRGEEHWKIIVHPDKSRTIESKVRLDATEIYRVTVLRIDEDFRPIDLYQTLWSGGEVRGSGYFWVTKNTLQSVITTKNGTLQQQVTVPDNFSWVSHPLAADSLHMSYYDEAQGGVQPATVYTMGLSGATISSILGHVHDVDLELVGEEEIDVPAGRFLTKKYLMANGLYEIWVGVEDHVMVRARYKKGGQLYELTKLEKMRVSK